MFITPHTAVALWLSTKTGNPYLGLVYGLFSHFIIDIIPHGDEKMGYHIEDKNKKRKYILKIGLVDISLASILMFLVWSKTDIWSVVAFWAVAGAWAPDGVWLLASAIEHKLIKKLANFHHTTHHLLNKGIGFKFGILLQFAFTVFFLLLLFKI